ncbi:MAG: hypothetical protein KatS3mg062_0096 [Tepidiforma sp.]|nr:MAG: hypothetical protein KatS3mg062_0096 [Tepidiforma sp.]
MVIVLLAVPAKRAGAAGRCIDANPAALDAAVLEANVIVVGTVREAPDGPELQPEAFLKGTVSREVIRFSPAALPEGCSPAKLEDADRVLVFLTTQGSLPAQPAATAAFVLRDGLAVRADGGGQALPEVQLVERIRALTGQEAVPPEAGEQGAGIELRETILPVGVLLLAVFGIGLVLMRVWHRIDPS